MYSPPFEPAMEQLCGRPLWLEVWKETGKLCSADGYFNLQVIGLNGGLATELVTEVECLHSPFASPRIWILMSICDLIHRHKRKFPYKVKGKSKRMP